MAITFPLSTPTNIGIANIVLGAESAFAVSQSPFTFVQQVVKHPGERWKASISLPPMKRIDSEPWVSFLLSLNTVQYVSGVGYYGTFLLGDPNGADAQGSASTLPGTPLVNGGSQTGNTLVIDGCPASKTGYLKAGDYIQLGSGSSSRLYKVLTDTNTNGSGQATLDIWPALRTSPSDNDSVVVSNAKGLFRLSSNIQQWEINDISSYGISFDCVEAL